MDIDKIIADVRFACQLLDQIPHGSLGRAYALHAQLILYGLLAREQREMDKKNKVDARLAATAGAEIIDLAAYRRRV